MANIPNDMALSVTLPSGRVLTCDVDQLTRDALLDLLREGFAARLRNAEISTRRKVRKAMPDAPDEYHAKCSDFAAVDALHRMLGRI